MVTLMMQAVNTFEMSISFYQITQRDHPDDGYLQLNWFTMWQATATV
jgi:hypothetical protein